MAALLIIIIAMTLGAVLRGGTLDVFWEWFINGPAAPFQSAPDLSFAQALGVSLVVSFLTYQFTNSESESSDDATEAAVLGLVKLLAIYAILWILALVYKAILGA